MLFKKKKKEVQYTDKPVGIPVKHLQMLGRSASCPIAIIYDIY